ncbi:Uncharacterized protein APZ42_007413 [Daphnia magna]|uniref:Uncharacterized protein n=1 Tax=Daphnia magna TaxID=35525 RepID=A0A162BUF1_9CRUS|nr:Uncharacterized protein APZ42_007413 [Daphnia magna]
MNDRSFHSLNLGGQARWCWEHTVTQSCLRLVHILCWLLFTQVINNPFCVFPKAKDSISCLLHLNPVDSYIY